MSKIFWNVREVASALNVGRSTVYDLMKRGAFETAKIGGRRIVRIDSVVAYANSLTRVA